MATLAIETIQAPSIHMEARQRAAILLALGDPAEALDLERRLTEEFAEAVQVYRAPSGFDAMSLALNRPSIIILDQRLPDVMGLDIIDPIREQVGRDCSLLFVGGSGRSGMRPGMRDEAFRRGASAICDRPLDMRHLLGMIRQIIHPEAPPHPHLHGLELLDLVQMFHQKRSDRTLRVFADDGRVGSIYINRGEISHIEAGGASGFNAMLDLMRWTEGRIVVFDALLSSQRSNRVPTQHLILEAARIMDEGEEAAAEPARVSAASPGQGGAQAVGDALDDIFGGNGGRARHGHDDERTPENATDADLDDY